MSEVEARRYEKAEGGRALCRACPHRCDLAPEEVGRCGARVDWGGVLYATNFEEVSALEEIPVEALPLAAFRPGTRVVRVGGTGDPLPLELAPFRMAPSPEECRWASAAEVVDVAAAKKAHGIAFAGGEPLMALESILPIAERARAEKLYTAAVTSGFASVDAAREAAALLDAANVALLASEASYRLRVGAHASRAPCLEAAQALREKGVHLELTALVVAGEEPARADLDALVAAASSLGNPPLHVASPAHFETAASVKAVQAVHAALAGRLPNVLLGGAYRY